MQANLERISPVSVKLSVEVPAADFKKEVNRQYNEIAKTSHIRGFRPGKAPRAVLERMFAPKVYEKAIETIVNTTLPKAMAEHQINAVSQPVVEPHAAAAADDNFRYQATCEVPPEITDVVFEGFELKKPAAVATEAMVEKELAELQKRHSTLATVEPARPSALGDVVVIDFALSVEGKEMPDGSGRGVHLELGSGQVLPDLEKGVVGHGVGDEFKIEATFPADHPSEVLRGKSAEFSVKLGEIKQRVLPTVDDEFAKKLGAGETVVELRANIHTQLEKGLKERAEVAVAEQIVNLLNEKNSVDVPPSLVAQQQNLMVSEIAYHSRRMNQRFGKEEAAALAETVKADAEKKVRAGLLMAAIAKKHGFKVTDEDMEKGMAELAAETGKNIAKVRAEYRDQSRRNVLIGMILEDKILDFIESKSTVVVEEAASESKEGA